MQWTVRYNPRGDVWDLNFPPQYMNTETEEFSQFETMADVLAEALETLYNKAVSNLAYVTD